MVSLAPEPEPGLALTRKAHRGALDLRSDREPADLRISGHELDMAIDAEIPPGVVPHMSGVGHGLIHERLGAETRALLRASLGHDHAPPRASCAATPAMAAFTSWSFRSPLLGSSTLEASTDISAPPVTPTRGFNAYPCRYPNCSEATTSVSTIHHGFAADGQF